MSKAKAAASLEALALDRDLSLGKPPRSFFLCGEDVSLREWLLDRVRAFHRRRGDETVTLSADQEGPASVLDLAQQSGLFSSGRLIVIRDAEALLEKKASRLQGGDQARLEEILARPPEGIHLALISGREDRKRDALDRAFTRSFASWGRVYVCDPLSAREFQAFCGERAGESGVSLRAEDYPLLWAFCGGRAGRAAREVERLAISGAAQSGSLATAAWGAVFAWVDDLLRGRPAHPSAMGPVEADTAIMTLGLIRSRYRLALDCAQGRGLAVPLYPESRAAVEVASKRLGRLGLENILLGLARLDRAVRSGSLSASEALLGAPLLESSAQP